MAPLWSVARAHRHTAPRDCAVKVYGTELPNLTVWDGQSASVIQLQPAGSGLAESSAHSSEKDPGLSLSSVTVALKSAGIPSMTGSLGGWMVTVGALLMGSVKSKHPDNPSTAAEAM